MTFFIDAMPSWFQVRPNSDRSIVISVSSCTSSLPDALSWIGADTDRLRPATSRLPSRTSPSGPAPSRCAVKTMYGCTVLLKKSAERRCLSRLAFLVSIDSVATFIVPVTPPSADAWPSPVTAPKLPLTGAMPHMLRLRSPMEERGGSRTQVPGSSPVLSKERNAVPVMGAAGGVMVPPTVWFGYPNSSVGRTYILRDARVKEGHMAGPKGRSSGHSAACLRLMQVLPRVARGMRRS